LPASPSFGSSVCCAIFVGLLLVASAVASAVLILYRATPDNLIASGIYQFGRTVAYQVTNVYAMKMAGVFMISTCTASVRTGILPHWMAFLGYALALLLLLGSGSVHWAPLVFPLWVLLISVHILAEQFRRSQDPSGRSGI
jgi:hypothetical protein